MRTLSIVVLMLVLVGCDDEARSPTSPVQPIEKAVQEIDETVEEDVLTDVPDRIFGLPVPGRITHHREIGGRVRLITKNDMETVHAFFSSQLVDYEVVQVATGYLAIGLHPYQSRVEYRRKGRLQYPIEIIYQKGAPKKKVEVATKSPKPVKGSPVEIRTADGKLLAPGARWGVSYTPPVDSPLNKKKFRSNFGKPFGTWVEQ